MLSAPSLDSAFCWKQAICPGNGHRYDQSYGLANPQHSRLEYDLAGIAASLDKPVRLGGLS